MKRERGAAWSTRRIEGGWIRGGDPEGWGTSRCRPQPGRPRTPIGSPTFVVALHNFPKGPRGPNSTGTCRLHFE